MLIYILLILILAALVLFVRTESTVVEVNHYKVPVGEGRLKDEVKIAHLSDIHISKWVSADVLEKAVKRINAENVDYVVITGDFITHFREYIPFCARVLSGLKASKKIIGILGNHDYWVDAEYLTAGLEDAGITILKNENFTDNDIFWAGVDDPYTFHDDIDASLEGKPHDRFPILLSHDPDIIEKVRDKNIGLILSGHTHGGQIRLPFIGALYIPSDSNSKYDAGWFSEQSTRLFVNRGFGVVFPPYRTFCRKEIVIMNLVPENGEVERIKRDFLSSSKS
jgi:uncharacterized protein